MYVHSFPAGSAHGAELERHHLAVGRFTKATYKWDGMERQDYEQREDYNAGWTAQYTTMQRGCS